MLKYFILLAFACYVFAACPTFDTVTNLNLAQQLGTWQVQGVLRNPAPIGQIQCLQIALSNRTNLGQAPVNLTVHGHGTDIDNNGTDIVLDVEAQVPTLSRPGRWNVNYSNLTFVGSVIYSDYVQYSLLALCNDAFGVDQLVVLFLSRSHDEMPGSVVEGFQSTLRNEYQVNTTNYRSIFHSHHACGH